MFTMNLSAHGQTTKEIGDLRAFIASNARFWIDNMYGETMTQTADAKRMKHLQQVLDNLPALTAKARETMSEPARA